MLTNPPVLYDFCDSIPISCLLTVGRGVNARLAQCLNSVFNVKAVVATFNNEKALVGAFSVITNLRMELFQALLLSLNSAS